MNMKDLKEMCQIDTKIDTTDLDGYSISIPDLANKYHQLRHDEKNVLRFIQSQYKILKLLHVGLYQNFQHSHLD